MTDQQQTGDLTVSKTVSKADHDDIMHSVNHVLSQTGFGIVTITIKHGEVAEIATTVTKKSKVKGQLLT
jgi:uncharacterized protein (DUF302 family)